MEHVRLLREVRLRAPVLVTAFSGWNDAGDAASGAVQRLAAHWGAEHLGDIDPQPFTNFGTTRPTVTLVDGRRVIDWPAVDIWTATLPGCDVVIVLGPEPALRWRSFCQELAGLAATLDVGMVIQVGALLADFPHTRPVQVISTSSDDGLLERFDLRRPTYEGPTGILGALADTFATAGVPAASLWAAVPSYAAQLPAPRASAALADRLCTMLGVDAPQLFGPEITKFDVRLAALLDENDELAEYVERLEALADERADVDEPDWVASDDSEAMTPAESAVFLDELERFLRQSGGGGAGRADGDDGDDSATGRAER